MNDCQGNNNYFMYFITAVLLELFPARGGLGTEDQYIGFIYPEC